MKRSRFTEERIIGILREQEAGMQTAEGVSQARHIAADVARLESKVRRHERPGRQAAWIGRSFRSGCRSGLDLCRFRVVRLERGGKSVVA